MRKFSPLLVSPVMMTGLTVVIAIILLASNFTIINAQQQQQQVQSDGGLRATLNGSSFTRGDTITIRGTVEERQIDSFVAIEVIGPNSETVESGYPAVTADNTFTYSFVAGEDTQFDTTLMEESGNYRVVVRYQQPGEDITSEDYFAEVEFVFGYTNNATAPQPQTGPIINSQPATIQSPTLFRSTSDSIRVEVPHDWIIQDIDNAGPAQLEEVRQGYGILMQLCPEEQATAAAAPTTNTISSINASRCLGAQEVIHIIRYPDLDTRLSANNVTTAANNTTTIDNILTYHLQKLQDVGYRSMRIVNSTDMTVDIINPQTNETLTTVPGRLVEMAYSTNFAPNEMKRGYFILTAGNETVPNVGTTKGYGVFYEGNSKIGADITATTSASSSLRPTPLPTPVKQTFDSFQLIAAPEATQAVVQTGQGGDGVGQVVQGQCDPSYPDICIPPPPPNLNCEDVGFLSFRVLPPDPHDFDGNDNDGIGCELQGDSGNDGDVGVGDGDEDNDEDNSCHPSYPDICIPPPPPNLNCDDIDARNFEVSGSDPHGFDGDSDGIGCESGSNDSDNDEDNGADDGNNDEDGGGGEDGGSDNGGGGEPEPEPEPEPGEGGGNEGEGNEGEGDGGNNPNEFEDCEVVGGGEDGGDVGC